MRNLVVGNEVTVYFSGIPTTVLDAGLANAIRGGAIGAESSSTPFGGLNPNVLAGDYPLDFRRPGWYRILDPNAPFESPWPRTYFLASERARLTAGGKYSVPVLKSILVWAGGNGEVNWIESGRAGAHISGGDNVLDKLIMLGVAAGAIAVTGGAVGFFGTSGAVGIEPAFVGPIETPLLVGPVEVIAPTVAEVVAPAAVADIAPFIGPIEPLVTTAPGWTLAETVAAAKAVGTSIMEGVKVVNQVAGAVGAVAAVSAAIQGPAGGSAPSPAPAPAPPPDSVGEKFGEKFGAVFDDLKTQLSGVDKKTWYMVGAVVLLSLG